MRGNIENGNANGIPKTSSVARSNSLRSSSPPRLRRDYRTHANVPPAVPENEVMMSPGGGSQGPLPPHMEQPYPLPVHRPENRPMNYVCGLSGIFALSLLSCCLLSFFLYS